MRALALAGALTLLGASPASAGDWPQWHGPNSDLISTESGWSTDWPAGGPKVLWKIEVGIGFSTVSVADGRVYTMGNLKEGGEETDIVWCLDAESGKPVWTHKYACPQASYPGPRVTPTVDGDRVYTLSREGHLFALGAKDGKVHWKKHAKDDFGCRQTRFNWGFACSPFILGDRLILDLGKTLALDKKTGELVWSSGTYEAGFSTPTLTQIGDDTYINSFNAHGLVIVNAKDGKEVANAEWSTSYRVNAASPIAFGNKIFISSGYDYGCGLFELKSGKLEQVYQNREMRNHCNSCVLYKGKLYGIDGQMGARNGRLKCIDPETGETVWEERNMPAGGLMIADGKILAMLDKGELVVAEAKPDGYKELARAEIFDGHQCWTHPVLANGRIYCRSNKEGQLACLDVRK